MTYYLIAVFVVSGYTSHQGLMHEYEHPRPVNLGTFYNKEACLDAAHKVELFLKQHHGAAICVQTK